MPELQGACSLAAPPCQYEAVSIAFEKGQSDGRSFGDDRTNAEPLTRDEEDVLLSESSTEDESGGEDEGKKKKKQRRQAILESAPLVAANEE